MSRPPKKDTLAAMAAMQQTLSQLREAQIARQAVAQQLHNNRQPTETPRQLENNYGEQK